jgi:Phage protein Gp138 N-terminal domain
VNDVTGDGYTGRADETTGAAEFNALTFLINQVISAKWTITLCQVKSVQGGGIAASSIVSVQPMVSQVDGQGNATPHGTISNIPVLRLQGGNNAVIIDPVVGDIGILACASRDISSVKANQAVSNPGSLRAFDPADGIYIGGVLNKAPTQYVLFSQSGIKIVDANNNVIETKAAGVSINGLLINQQGQVAGNLPVTGNLQIAGTITSLPGGTFAGNITTTGSIQGSSVSNGSIDLATHHHVAPAGGGNTGPALP